MADYKDKLVGAPSAIATYVSILSGTSIIAAGTQLSRRYVSVAPDIATVYYKHGAAATSTLNQPLGPGVAALNEEFYTGPIYLACASGASAGAFVNDVFGNV